MKIKAGDFVYIKPFKCIGPCAACPQGKVCRVAVIYDKKSIACRSIDDSTSCCLDERYIIKLSDVARELFQ